MATICQKRRSQTKAISAAIAVFFLSCLNLGKAHAQAVTRIANPAPSALGASTKSKQAPAIAPAKARPLLIPAPYLTSGSTQVPQSVPPKRTGGEDDERLFILNHEKQEIEKRLNSALENLSKNPAQNEAIKTVNRLRGDSAAINREIAAIGNGKSSPKQGAASTQIKTQNSNTITSNFEVKLSPPIAVQSEGEKHFEAWDIFQNFGTQKENRNETEN